MKRFFLFVVLSVIIFCSGFIFGRRSPDKALNQTINEIVPFVRTLDKYTIENLQKTQIPEGTFEIKDKISEEEKYISYKFIFKFAPSLEPKRLIKKTSGQINIPKANLYKSGDINFPVIIMFRGYVDQTIYQTGIGTKSAAAFFADNGFITVSPDFLGYADSDPEAGNIFETRFQTYVTAITLLKTFESMPKNQSLISVNNSLEDKTQLKSTLLNRSALFLWGHSNGGQIAVTSLEILKTSYPTTLWAPVTKPFPYSILYYTDDSIDGGKLIRSQLSNFEDNYDTGLYSLTNYLKDIIAPIQIHQGTSDDAVPFRWSDEFAAKLKNLDKDITYYKYVGADHNLKPSWNTVVERDLNFFQKYISSQ